jgi:cyclopropane fatty-acyl-phospholipid synthase-like methyltransferase
MKSSKLDEAAGVRDYFDSHSDDFDSIYEESRKSKIRQVRDRLSRQTVLDRLTFVMDRYRSERPKSVLDVGCGGGRFAVPLAREGATVTGIDFAPDMIRIAEEYAASEGVPERCTFLATDYQSWKAESEFDFSLGIGLFDYVRDPRDLVHKMRLDTSQELIASFPQKYHPLVPLRTVRLRSQGCPVFFYTESDVRQLVAPEFEIKSLEKFGRDYMVVASPKK